MKDEASIFYLLYYHPLRRRYAVVTGHRLSTAPVASLIRFVPLLSVLFLFIVNNLSTVVVSRDASHRSHM